MGEISVIYSPTQRGGSGWRVSSSLSTQFHANHLNLIDRFRGALNSDRNGFVNNSTGALIPIQLQLQWRNLERRRRRRRRRRSRRRSRRKRRRRGRGGERKKCKWTTFQ